MQVDWPFRKLVSSALKGTEGPPERLFCFCVYLYVIISLCVYLYECGMTLFCFVSVHVHLYVIINLCVYLYERRIRLFVLCLCMSNVIINLCVYLYERGIQLFCFVSALSISGPQ